MSQAIAKGNGMAFAFDGEVLVRELTVKGAKCIQLQKIGERKEHQFKFEVHLLIVYHNNSSISFLQSAIEHKVWFDQLRKATQSAAATINSAGIDVGTTPDLIVRRDRNAHRLLQQSSSTPAILQ